MEKRIKRRITARDHIFFAACAPGLKRLCHRELIQQMPDLKNVNMIPGGVEFSGTVQDCYKANLYLRSPSRITMRIAGFKAENFRTLEKRLQEIEWELYLKKGIAFSCDAVTRHCRLYHSDAISQRVEKQILDYFDQLPHERNSSVARGIQSASQRILIRGEDDRFEISLDSSGDGLYKRGLKKYVGAAPLRETLAFALLSAAEYTPGKRLIDGMCGSGSFSLEAAMITRNMAPGLFRFFSFEQWPCFSEKQWHYLKNEATKQIKLLSEPTVFASDLDLQCVEALEKTVEEFDLSSTIQVFPSDFFALRPDVLSSGPGVAVLNPPYGKRIGSPATIKALYKQIGEKLESDFKGWTVVIIMPDRQLAESFSFSHRWMPLFHGGLELHAAIGRV
ncbi:THUMP domain-containing class I SAM-dependent RNA methyltransferase [Desulfocicer vacuolatum]|uniref:THUMP domain-containing class I SAM-dependent RNA methyltransferase n=1 Tax=Desulfocicer vacuolatum TaxID=2298 RepID=UPI001BAE97FA|nr:RNA methyltransferase [Desulfocicer vacuolatum]